MLASPHKLDHDLFSVLNSAGKSIPTLLAVSRILSSSSINMPGLYRSRSVV